ncbi:MAG: glutamine synthetase family protein [Chloroflexota bacterium]|nr:glutamine synthetase family protein [Chloroflexota bacterium]
MPAGRIDREGGIVELATTDGAARNLLARLERDGINHLWLVYTDYNGRSQGKSVPHGRFPSTVSRGITFARANLGHNVTDHAPPDTAFGAETGDFFALPDPDTYAQFPLFPATGRVLCWMKEEDGSDWDGCPRTMLQRQIDAFAAEGLTVQAAFEPEAYLFREDSAGAVAPAMRTGMFTIAGLAANALFFHQVSDTLEGMGIRVEQVATEYGPGQIEINIQHAHAMKAADDLVTLKEVAQAIGRQAGLIVSFMPKPFAEAAGSGLHVHLSLWSAETGHSAMESETDHHDLSPVGRGFIGGLLRHAPALVGLGSPTVNSYKRLQPGSWAPAHAAYGVGNRAALIRVPGSSRNRIEVRSGDNTCNPYLYLTALLAAGLEGIRIDADPGPPATGDLGHLTEAETKESGIGLLPRNAIDALAAVESDRLMVEALGPTILPEWLRVKRSEIAAYDLAVSDWERSAYLAI